MTIEYDHEAPVLGGQRSVARDLAPANTLTRRQTHRDALVNVHQKMGDSVILEADAVYSALRDFGQLVYTSTGSLRDVGNTNANSTRSFAMAPRLIADLRQTGS